MSGDRSIPTLGMVAVRDRNLHIAPHTTQDHPQQYPIDSLYHVQPPAQSEINNQKVLKYR